MPCAVQGCAHFLQSGADHSGAALLQYPGFTACLTYAKTCSGLEGSEILGERGAIVLPSVSRLTNMTLHTRGGGRRALTGEAKAAGLMQWETRDICRFIGEKAPLPSSALHEEYCRFAEITLGTSQVMEEIRRQAGIFFPTAGQAFGEKR